MRAFTISLTTELHTCRLLMLRPAISAVHFPEEYTAMKCPISGQFHL